MNKLMNLRKFEIFSSLQYLYLFDHFRELQTIVEIPLSLFTKREGMQCRCLYKELLPSSTYVDTFQLKSVSKHLGFDVSNISSYFRVA